MLEKAEEYGCHREKATPPEADVELDMPLMEVRVGDDFELKLEFNNTSDQARTVDVYVSGNVVYYTGVTSSEFLFKTPRVILDPKKGRRVEGRGGAEECVCVCPYVLRGACKINILSTRSKLVALQYFLSRSPRKKHEKENKTQGDKHILSLPCVFSQLRSR